MQIFRQSMFLNSCQTADLRILQDGFVTTDETWEQKPLYASYSRLYFIAEGTGMLLSDDETMPLEKGYVYLAPCGTKCGFYGTPSVTKLFFHINLFFTKDGGDAFEGTARFLRLPCEVSKIERLKELYFSKDPLNHFYLQSELYQTVSAFFECSKETQNNCKRFPKTVSDSLAFIRANLRAKLTAREVAQHAFCSPGTLNLLFRQEIGQSVSAYIDDLLMSAAQTLLLYSSLSIGEISEQLGFCDQFYFSRCFTKRFSISPQKYRKIQSSK